MLSLAGKEQPDHNRFRLLGSPLVAPAPQKIFVNYKVSEWRRTFLQLHDQVFRRPRIGRSGPTDISCRAHWLVNLAQTTDFHGRIIPFPQCWQLDSTAPSFSGSLHRSDRVASHLCRVAPIIQPWPWQGGERRCGAQERFMQSRTVPA